MKTKLFLFIAICLSLAVFSQTHVPPGPISGIWTLARSPFLIEGETTIPNDSTLTIEPGVLVEWQGSYTMHVQGQILAIGTETDSVIFTATDQDQGFRSIRFIDTPVGNDTSWFVYCAFKYGKVYGVWPDNSGGAIAAMNWDKLVIDHCLFAHNKANQVNLANPGGGAIALWTSSPDINNCKFINNTSVSGGAIICYLRSHPTIEDNVFTSNVSGEGTGGAICCYVNSDPKIKHNTFSNNISEYGGAISCVDTCNPEIYHNLFYENLSIFDGGAISLLTYCSPALINNTIAGNIAKGHGGGLEINHGCAPNIKNTILWGNTALGGSQVYIFTSDCTPNFHYSDIEGGQEAFGGIPHIGDYLHNIDSLPLFEDIITGDFNLTPNSPCIDMGYPIVADPDNTRCEIGIYYFDQRPISALEATHIEETSFVANWEEAEGATAYLLDIATDPNFDSFVEGFQNLDVGNVVSFSVEGLEPSTFYYYRLRANYYFGRSNYSDTITTTIVSYADTEYILKTVNVFPNPFTSSTIFEYGLTHNAPVIIEVYNMSGQKVQRLFNDQQKIGKHQLNWDTSLLPKGIYFVRLQIEHEVITKKIIKM